MLMGKFSNKLILGLGTGRCGTVNLSDFLKQQPDMAICTHECLKWKWYGEPNITEKNFEKYSKFENSIVGDVGSFLLPHVEAISNFFNETKLIVVKRDKLKTIASWMKWTHKRHNYWVPHKTRRWLNDGWDGMFPKFDLELKPKKEAIEAYYNFYYEECKKLEQKYDTLWIETEKLEEKETRIKICNFCGFNLLNCKLDVKCRRNESK